MKKFVGIGDADTIIMLIPVEHLPATLRNAQSVRNKLSGVMAMPDTQERRRISWL